MMDKELEAIMLNMKKEVQIQTLEAIIKMCEGLRDTIKGEEE
jgi:hypothetical protein